MNIDTRNQVLTIVFGIVILILAYVLYDSIVTPYQVVEERKAMTEKVRNRMMDVKDALVQYESNFEHFPPTDGGLDSVVQFLKTDSLMIVMGDSLFGRTFDAFNPDSLVYSPRTGKKFQYTLNDTLRPQIYLLEDPDTDDTVGSLERTTMRNAPNWN